MQKIFGEGIVVKLAEKWGLNDILGMKHHLILVRSLLFDQNLIGNFHLDILV